MGTSSPSAPALESRVGKEGRPQGSGPDLREEHTALPFAYTSNVIQTQWGDTGLSALLGGRFYLRLLFPPAEQLSTTRGGGQRARGRPAVRSRALPGLMHAGACPQAPG